MIAQSGARAGRGRHHQPHAAARLRAALGSSDLEVGAILRVHPSNFRAVGFVEEVAIEALCGLGVPVIDDVGSGVLADGIPALADEPALRRSVAGRRRAGLLLGRQAARRPAGGAAGRPARAVAPRARASAGPRAADRQAVAGGARRRRWGCTATRRGPARRSDPGAARCSTPQTSELGPAASALAERRPPAAPRWSRATGQVGGGALPLLELEGPVVALNHRSTRDPVAIAAGGVAGDRPVIARDPDGRGAARPADADRRRDPPGAGGRRAPADTLPRR